MTSPQQASSPPSRGILPITLVCGFLGAGKTSLLQHIICEHQGQGRFAFVVMDSTEINYDERGLRGLCAALGREDHLVIGLQDDTSKPRWQEALPEIVRDCAQSGNFARLFIEVGGRVDMQSVMKTLPAAEPSLATLGLRARVDCSVAVLNAFQLWHELAHPVMENRATHGSAIAKMMASHARCANLVVLQHGEKIKTEEVAKVRDFIQLINPVSTIIDADRESLPYPQLMGPFEKDPPPSTPNLANRRRPPGETNILPPALAKAYLYEARRPFHPARFMQAFGERWPRTVIRTKGFFWLASRMRYVGGMSQIGPIFSCSVAGEWWASVPEERRPVSGYAAAELRRNWREPWGDRRNEIIVFGEADFATETHDLLDQALLTDEEMDLGPEAWADFDDPFPAWTEDVQVTGSV